MLHRGDNMALTITVIALIGAICLFILAENKEEVWNEILFEDDEDDKKSNLYKNRK